MQRQGHVSIDIGRQRLGDVRQRRTGAVAIDDGLAVDRQPVPGRPGPQHETALGVQVQGLILMPALANFTRALSPRFLPRMASDRPMRPLAPTVYSRTSPSLGGFTGPPM